MADLPTIFLLGYMGSGKSYTGKRLGALLDLPFIDLDTRIETKSGVSIADFIDREGLPAFRALEAACLRELPTHNVVVACGGGTPIHHDNLAWMNARGITFFLETPVEVLVRRLLPERAKRPLIANLEETALPGFIQEHLHERLPFYLKAHLRYTQRTGRESIAEDIRAYLIRVTGH